jgi:hypothetical protein
MPYKKNEVSTHTGLVVKWAGQFFIAEMTAHGITLSPFTKYDGTRRFILDIRRHAALCNETSQEALNREVAQDYRRSLEYDFKGAIGWVISRIKQDPKKYYCSEYFVWRTAEHGVIFSNKLLHRASPQDLYELKDWLSVPNWKGEKVC